jgi:maltose O-acetyltransferase
MPRFAFGRTFATVRTVDSRLWYVIVNVVAASGVITPPQRVKLYRFCGLRVGKAEIRHGNQFFGANIEIGDGVWLGEQIDFDNRALIVLKARSAIAGRCALVTSTHEIGGESRRAGPFVSKPIVIEEGAWLGYGATILAGVTVGRSAIVAAGAVVNRDCPPNTFVAGIPAKVVRELPMHDVSAV